MRNRANGRLIMAGGPDPVAEHERGTLAARIRTILSESAIYGVLVVSAMTARSRSGRRLCPASEAICLER